MGQRSRISRFDHVALLIFGFIAIALVVSQLLKAQFNDERRRADLGPLTLSGGSTVEFKSFDSSLLFKESISKISGDLLPSRSQ
jgi:hypothetical protein